MRHNLTGYVAPSLVIAALAAGLAEAQPGTRPAPAPEPAATIPASTQPAEPARLHCQVVNQAGIGLAKATVEAGTLGVAGWTALTTEITGVAGDCDVAFSGPQSTLLRLKVVAPGYRETEVVYVPNPRHVVPWLTISLKGAKELIGRVVTEDGEGVAGATVIMNTPAGEIRTQTSSAGYFEFKNLMPMKATLLVHVPGVGIGSYQVDVSAEEVKPVEIVLYSQRRVTLRVLGQDGKPVVGVMVAVLSPQATASPTDVDGKIQINGVGAGRGRVVVALEDDYYRLDEPAVGLDIDEGTEPVELEISATEGGLIEGQVVEQETGEPIPAAIVWIVADGKFGPNYTCDVEGKFKFPAVRSDDYLLAAGHATYGLAIAPASVEAGQKVDLTFRLPVGAATLREVTDPAGKPCPRAIVRAATWIPPQLADKIGKREAKPLEVPWRAVRANMQGQYMLENLPAGQIKIEAADEAGGFRTNLDVQVPEGDQPMELKIQLRSSQAPPPM